MINNETLRDIRVGMNLIEGDEYKDILEGVTQITCDVVSKTLGPYASTTVIDDGVSTYSTKDGWSVVNRIHFGDTIQNTLYKFIKDISFSLNSKVGDGTTTAIVAANNFIAEFRNWLDAQKNNPDSKYRYVRQADLLAAVETAATMICQELASDKRLMRVKGPADIFKIANISTNGNSEVANMIAKIYEETDNPNIHVTLNIGGATHAEIEEGYKLDTTLLNPNCHYNTSEQTCVLNGNTKVIIFNHNVTYVEHYAIVQDLINSVINQPGHKNLVVMAPYFDDMFTSVASSAIRKIVNAGQISPFVLVQFPYATTIQKCFINDFAVLCGTEIFDYTKVKMYNQMQSALKGESSEFDEYAKLREVSDFKSPEDILAVVTGTAKHLTIGKNFTLLKDFDKTTSMYVNTMKMIEDAFNEAKAKADSTGNRMTMGYSEAHMRYVKFFGRSGTIYVGGESELSCKCLKDAVDDAVLACRSAYENGYVRGMNIETISSINKLLNTKNATKNDLVTECLKMFGRVFVGVTEVVMYNKYRNDGYSIRDFRTLPWNLTYKSDSSSNTRSCNKKIMEDPNYKLTQENENVDYVGIIVTLCAKYGFEYNLVTESFGPAGYSVVNSVSTDVEVIKATTSILTLLLSSSQLVSINKGFDKKLSREEGLKNERSRYENLANGIIDAFKNGNIGGGISMSVYPQTTLETTTDDLMK